MTFFYILATVFFADALSCVWSIRKYRAMVDHSAAVIEMITKRIADGDHSGPGLFVEVAPHQRDLECARRLLLFEKVELGFALILSAFVLFFTFIEVAP